MSRPPAVGYRIPKLINCSIKRNINRVIQRSASGSKGKGMGLDAQHELSAAHNVLSIALPLCACCRAVIGGLGGAE